MPPLITVSMAQILTGLRVRQGTVRSSFRLYRKESWERAGVLEGIRYSAMPEVSGG
jgi:hypothetical protein